MKRLDVDILVGTKVLGWEYDEGEWIVNGQSIRPHFNPSSDISHTWEVLEHIFSPPHTMSAVYLSKALKDSNHWMFPQREAALQICRAILFLFEEDIYEEEIED